MKVHNLLEDIVSEKVEEIFKDEEEHPVAGFCTCDQCRMDVTCYVLNRTKPEYIISGRGFAHLKTDYETNAQIMADLTALIMEGIKKVSRTKRPFFPHTPETGESQDKGPVFNFPIIAGRIFNGKTFEPISGVDVTLTSEGNLVPMKNRNWQNPYRMAESTAGNYMFWPSPLRAEKTGQEKTFPFQVSVHFDTYEDMSHVFTLTLTASDEQLDTICLNENYNPEDLYLFSSSSPENILGAET
ncbi:MAG: late competence development ComFB family protein [Spirochaetales bacterium]|nr:late competence development ComFB family protein [Spirochaetales bacterium]